VQEDTRSLPPDDCFLEAVAAFQEARDAGENPATTEWLLRYPDVADRLRAFFAGEKQLRIIASPVRSMFSAVKVPNIPDYQILGDPLIGGMGLVFKALRKSTGQTIALKLIRPDLLAGLQPSQHRKLVERFITEAQVAAHLEHENIVKVYDVGEFDGQPYYAMRYVEGTTLAALMEKGALPASRAALYLEQVARAVHDAHQHAIIHRDLKPNNVLIDAKTDRALVADFGLAKLIDRDQERTRTGNIMGAPPYISPEMAQNSGRATTATDVYGLGATLYAILTGRPPFQDETPLGTLRKVLEEEPPAPRKINPAVPRDLETICLKCLHKRPSNRYASAAELADDLHNFREGLPINARPTSRFERARKWARRRPAVAALVAVSAASVLSLLVLFAALWRNAEDRAAAVQQLDAAASQIADAEQKLDDLNESVKKQQETLEEKLATVKQLEQLISKQREKVREAKLGTRQALYIRDMQFAQTALDRDQIGRLGLLLEKHLPPPGELDLRGFEWHYLWHTCHHEMLLLNGHSGPISVNSGAFATDGKILITANDSGVWVWDMTTGKGRRVALDGDVSLRVTAVAPDGETLATGNKTGVVQLWDLGTGREKTRFQAHQGTIEALAFGPSGRLLATGGTDQTARVWDLLAPNDPPLILRGHGGKVNGLSFSPDGKLLAALTGDKPAKLWDLATGVQKAELRGKAGAWVIRVAFAPDGQTWATSEAHPFHNLRDGRVQIWDARTGQVRATLDVSGGGAFGLSFSPDGRYLAVGGSSGTVLLYDVATRKDAVTPKLHRVFRGHTARVFLLAFSPSATLLATAGNDSSVRVWDLAAMPPAVALRGHNAAINCVAIAPDGKTVATASDDGFVRMWDPQTGRAQSVFKEAPGWRGPLAFSPNSKFLVTGVDGRTLRLWNIAAGEQVVAFRGHTGRVTWAAFAPDGKILATSAHDHTVRLWDVATGVERAVLLHDEIQVWSVAFTPDGQTLISATEDGQVTLWDASTAKPRAELPRRERGALCVAVSPDGGKLAVAHFIGFVTLWDIESRSELAIFKELPGHALQVTFTPDGKSLASVSDDGTVKLWDLATRQELFALRGNPATGLLAVAVSRDSTMLAAGGDDGILHLWSARINGADRTSPASAVSTERVYAWQLKEAVSCLQQNQRAPALFHVNRLLGATLPAEVLAAEPAVQSELAVNHIWLGELLQRAGLHHESEQVVRRAIALWSKLRQEYPSRAEYRQKLGVSLNTLGLLLRQARRMPEAEQVHRQALEVRQQLVDEFAANPEYRWALGGTLNNLALVLRGQGSREEAIRLLHKAVACQQEALRARPRHPPYRQYLSSHLRNLADTYVQVGEHGKAADVAAAMPRLLPDDGWQVHQFAARLLCQCVTLAEKDGRLAEPSRTELAADYAQRAVDQVAAAINKGFSDTAGLKTDPTFAPLRETEGFQVLLRMFEKNKGDAGK
jgi:WD40 repeat protein/serine/threonine protein kinase/tetratricopeptide (TPR) repeat protein